MSFLDILKNNPFGAFGGAPPPAQAQPQYFEDDAGNKRDAQGNVVDPFANRVASSDPAPGPQPSLMESLKNIAYSPVQMAVGAIQAPIEGAKHLFGSPGAFAKTAFAPRGQPTAVQTEYTFGTAPHLWEGPDAPGNARAFADVASPFFGGEAFGAARGASTAALTDAAKLGSKIPGRYSGNHFQLSGDAPDMGLPSKAPFASDPKTQRLAYDILNHAGEDAGRVELALHPESGQGYIDNMTLLDNPHGTGGMRDVMRSIKAMHPDISRLYGERTSGALAGTENPTQSVNLFSDTGKTNPLSAAVTGSLPMDEASRLARAREMGFDTDRVFYHGTNKDFPEFSLDKAGSGTSGEVPGAPPLDHIPAVWFQDDPSRASQFATGGGYGEVRDGANVIPAYLRPKDMDYWDMGHRSITSERDTINRALKEAKEAGSRGVVFQNLIDTRAPFAAGKASGANVVAMFHPEDIRSKFAAFNPADKDKAGLLLSDTGKVNPLTAAIGGVDNKDLSDAAGLGKMPGKTDGMSAFVAAAERLRGIIPDSTLNFLKSEEPQVRANYIRKAAGEAEAKLGVLDASDLMRPLHKLNRELMEKAPKRAPRPPQPSDEIMNAEYNHPSEIPPDVYQAATKKNVITSDANDAVRWARILGTNKDPRYPSGRTTVYRAVDGDGIREGDWVTTERQYAEDHNKRYLGGKGKIEEMDVDGRDLLQSPTGNSEEAIYAPMELSGPYSAYRKTKGKK
jgi:hypothetical protein